MRSLTLVLVFFALVGRGVGGVHASLQLRGNPSFRVRCLPPLAVWLAVRGTQSPVCGLLVARMGAGSTAVDLTCSCYYPPLVLGLPLTAVGMRART